MFLIAITGASGVSIAYKLLEKLKEIGKKREVIVSEVGISVLKEETDYSKEELIHLADESYDVNDLTAPPASGSHRFNAMVIVPCSMKTLASITHGYADNLITRAADVCIKEKRKLLLIPRESPLSVIHLENMLKLAKLGVIIAPPVPSFYVKPKNINDIVDHLVGRILDLLGIHTDFERWKG